MENTLFTSFILDNPDELVHPGNCSFVEGWKPVSATLREDGKLVVYATKPQDD